jgi:nucleoside phosphorylase
MSDEYISTKSLSWALRHIAQFGDTDLFPPLFEFDLIKKYWNHFLNSLASTKLSCYEWHAPRQWLIPKDQISFRAATQLDPLDSIMFTALIHDCAPAIEKLRIPVGRNSTFSYRLSNKRNKTLYEPHTRRDFWTQSKALTHEYSHVATLDITDFYNQIEHSAVLSQFEKASVPEVRRSAIGRLLFRTSGNSSRGIPTGPQASHLLAEAALIPLDNQLFARYRFTRYADDIHVFCKSIDDANVAIFQIADFLNKYQKLSLNRQKTSIKTGAEFRASSSQMLIDAPINEAEEDMLHALRHRLEEIGEIDADEYPDLQLSDLDRADAELFSRDLLESVLRAYLRSNPASYLRLRWFLRRISLVGADGAVEFVASHIERFAPAIVDAVRYLSSSAVSYAGSWANLGNTLIKSLNNPLIRANEYLQVSIIGLFWRVTDLNHVGKLLELFETSPHSIRREIVLALSAQASPDLVRQHSPHLPEMDAWLRRAILHAMRLLPESDRQKYAVKDPVKPEDLMTNCLLNVLIDNHQMKESTTKDTSEFQPAIGIITALPKEMAAMRSLLDKVRRANIDRAGGMKECYLGELPARGGGRHRVALALSGMGNNQGAARATNLLRDFPSIKYVFMVGIAGGIPDPSSAPNHVRLGDVVISGEHGVCQYDFVKETDSGIELRSSSRPPGAPVLEAVRFLESEMLSAPDLISDIIAKGLAKLKWRRPAARFDVLASTEDPEEKVKHPRDKSRRSGHPRIFVGPIASANVLLKNAGKRDRLRESYKVKAVEMEGSGIADASWNLGVGYMVIRGICDYCDKNKNDAWQEYAAMVAAAYATALLESMFDVALSAH